jgi:hypothetical protein
VERPNSLLKEPRVKDTYIEGFDFLGKEIERKRDKSLEIVKKEFIVGTGKT